MRDVRRLARLIGLSRRATPLATCGGSGKLLLSRDLRRRRAGHSSELDSRARYVGVNWQIGRIQSWAAETAMPCGVCAIASDLR